MLKIKNQINVINLLGILLFAILLMSCKEEVLDPDFSGSNYYPAPLNSTWQIVDNPESVGWSTPKLQYAYEYSKNLDTDALIVIYKGKVLYHWGNTTKNFSLHSCRKSLLSALYGIHVSNGNIQLENTMFDLGIDDKPPSLNEVEKTATIKMLLKSRSGIYHGAAYEAQSMKDDRPKRHSHLPGSFWYYNNWDFNALGTIFRQKTGKDIFVEFEEKIALPIGMENFSAENCFYDFETCSVHPAYPFRMTAPDFARFGQLFLQSGKWNEKQIIDKNWITESTFPYSYTGDANTHYGYMWWVNKEKSLSFPKNSYFASGNHGQMALIIPDMEVVIVHLVDSDFQGDVNMLELSTLVGLIIDAKKTN